ncbi:hypothetical protein B0H14DRAFT_2658410 [Mycena olivaceomarginata]|nr:hypothetical protein B0H14DRAFT_2658410 [Mycena olivaceomarginata]
MSTMSTAAHHHLSIPPPSPPYALPTACPYSSSIFGGESGTADTSTIMELPARVVVPASQQLWNMGVGDMSSRTDCTDAELINGRLSQSRFLSHSSPAPSSLQPTPSVPYSDYHTVHGYPGSLRNSMGLMTVGFQWAASGYQ